jgi:hypothetical protein
MRTWILAVAAVAASGCGGGGSAASPPRLPRALGAQLAAEADAVEASLARGDDCGAAAQAEQLREMVEQAVSAGQVPVGLERPLSRSAASLAGAITCTPAPAAGAPPDNGPGKEHGQDERHGPGKKHHPKKDEGPPHHRPGHDHGGGGKD